MKIETVFYAPRDGKSPKFGDSRRIVVQHRTGRRRWPLCSSIWRPPIELPKAGFGIARKVVVQRQLGLLRSLTNLG